MANEVNSMDTGKSMQQELDELVAKYNLSPSERELMENYMKAGPEMQEAVISFILGQCEKMGLDIDISDIVSKESNA